MSKAHIIAVYNFKGGVGKTTASYNLAYSWSKDRKVLIIDSDPQANITNAFFDQTKGKTLYQYIRTIIHNKDVELEPLVINPNLHLIPGDIDMIDLESNSHYIEFGFSLFKRFMQEIESQYDIIILDCPSYFGKTVKCIVGNSSQLLIPATPDLFSIKGVIKLLNFVKSIEKAGKLSVLGVFFNRYRRNFKYHKLIREKAKSILGPILLDRCIENTIKISESTDQALIKNKDFHLQLENGFDLLADDLIKKLDHIDKKKKILYQRRDLPPLNRQPSFN